MSSVSVGDILWVYNYVIKTLSLGMNKILSLSVPLYRLVRYTPRLCPGRPLVSNVHVSLQNKRDATVCGSIFTNIQYALRHSASASSSLEDVGPLHARDYARQRSRTVSAHL